MQKALLITGDHSNFTKYFLITSLLIIFVICLLDSAIAENINNIKWKDYFLGRSGDNNPPKPDQMFKFQFGVTSGTIDQITADPHADGPMLDIHSTDNGTLEIKFPRNYPFYQGYNNVSMHYTPSVVFTVNKMVINHYHVSTSDCFFVYSVPFSDNSEVDLIIAYPLTSNLPSIYHGDNISPSCNSQTILSYMPPLKQINAGVNPKDVQCVNGLVIVLHPVSYMPSCVKPKTSKILLERGWDHLP